MTTKLQSDMPARRGKNTIAVLTILALVGSIIFLAWGTRTGIAARPGIFGTTVLLFADLNLIA